MIRHLHLHLKEWFDETWTPRLESMISRSASRTVGSHRLRAIWVQFGCGVAAAQNGVATVPSDLDSGVPKILYKVDNGSDALTLTVQGYEDIL